SGGTDLELLQPGQQIADDDDFLGPAVGERRQYQHRDPPPAVRQLAGNNRGAQAERPGRQVQADPGQPDQRGEAETAKQVRSQPETNQADSGRLESTTPQQVDAE